MSKTARGNRVQVMLSDSELEMVDEWRHENHLATRSDAIRRLCQMAVTLDVDLEAVLDKSESLLASFEGTMSAIEEDMVTVKGNSAQPDVTEADADMFDLVLYNLRVAYQNTAELFDEYLWVYFHWLELNNVAQLVAQASNRRAALKAMTVERDRLGAIRDDLVERRQRSLDDGVGPTMPVEKLLPLSKGRPRPRRVKVLHSRMGTDVSS